VRPWLADATALAARAQIEAEVIAGAECVRRPTERNPGRFGERAHGVQRHAARHLQQCTLPTSVRAARTSRPVACCRAGSGRRRRERVADLLEPVDLDLDLDSIGADARARSTARASRTRRRGCP
jgi:hypothetical protein